MPLYDYECTSCGWEGEKTATIADRRAQTCPTCSSPLSLTFRPQPRYVPFNPYFDIGLGTEVTSWGHRRQVMKEQHCDHRDPPRPGDISARLDRVRERRLTERQR